MTLPMQLLREHYGLYKADAIFLEIFIGDAIFLEIFLGACV
jgi:hypothetical protein